MEVILDELRKNNIDMDMNTLSFYIKSNLEQHKPMFNNMAMTITPTPCNLAAIFYEVNVTNFGRGMTYLTMVYMLKDRCPQEVIRDAVRLVAAAFNNLDFSEFKIKESAIVRVFSAVKCVLGLND